MLDQEEVCLKAVCAAVKYVPQRIVLSAFVILFSSKAFFTAISNTTNIEGQLIIEIQGFLHYCSSYKGFKV